MSIPKPFVNYVDEMIVGIDTNSILKFDRGYIRIMDEVRGTKWEPKVKAFKVTFDKLVNADGSEILKTKGGKELKQQLQKFRTLAAKPEAFLI